MEDERGSPGARRRVSTENVNGSLQSEGETEPQVPNNLHEFEVPCTDDCPLKSDCSSASRNGKSEKKSSSPVGIRALYQLDEGDHGKPQTRASARQTAPISIPQHSPAHYCDPDIAAIVYRRHTPSSGWVKTTACRIPKVHFPCFGKKRKKAECWLEMHKSDYMSLTTKEKERLRKEEDWKKILEGRHGKSISQKQAEWAKGLRQYDECSSWQRHIGEHTRKKHRDKLIKAAVAVKPVSELQAIRTDAKMTEGELFETSGSLDEYKHKTYQIVDVFRSRRRSHRDQESVVAANHSKTDWRKSMARVRSKLKELLPAKKSPQNVAGESGRSQEPVAATACSCRAKEIKQIRLSSQEDSKGEALNQFLNNPHKMTYQPNSTKAKLDDHAAKENGPQHRSVNTKKSRRRPTKAQILREAQLDSDEWSVIDFDSPKRRNQSNCFGLKSLSD